MISRRFCSYCSWQFFGTKRSVITLVSGSRAINLAYLRLLILQEEHLLFFGGFISRATIFDICASICCRLVTLMGISIHFRLFFGDFQRGGSSCRRGVLVFLVYLRQFLVTRYFGDQLIVNENINMISKYLHGEYINMPSAFRF